MANGKQPNFTKVPNYLIEEISKRNFSSAEYSILLCIMRATLGWNKNKHAIGYSFLANATGLSKSTIRRTIKNLSDKKVIIIFEPSIGRKPSVLGINHRYSEWLECSRMTIVTQDSVECSPMTTAQCSSRDTTVVTYDHQKRNIKIDILKEEEKRGFPLPSFTEDELEELKKEGYEVM